MTVNSTTSFVQNPGNGSATVFGVGFLFLDADDLVVGLIDSSGNYTQQSNTTYTVTGDGNASGGNVTFNAAPAAGVTVDIRRATPELQPTNFSNLGAYLPETNTETADRLMLALQDLTRRAYTFGIHGTDTDVTPWPALPGASARAGFGLVFDANGLPTLGIIPTSTLTQTIFNTFLGASNLAQLLYPRTTAEIAASITPVNYFMQEGVVNRYQTNTTPGTTDMAPGFVAAWAVANAGGGQVVLLDQQYYVNTAVTVNMTGTRSTNGVVMRGTAPNRSQIVKGTSVTSGALFSWLGTIGSAGATIDSVPPTEVNFKFRDFSVIDPTLSRSADGLLINNLANISFSNVIVNGFLTNLNLQSALEVYGDDWCQFTQGTYGMRTAQNGHGGSTCNIIKFTCCKFNINASRNLYLDGGTEMSFDSCALEAGGTAGNTNTGSVYIAGTNGPDTLLASFKFINCHLEANSGYGYFLAAPVGGATIDVEIDGGSLLSQEAGQSLYCLGIASLSIKRLRSDPNAVFVMSAVRSHLEHVTAKSWQDGATYPYWEDVTDQNANYPWGRPDSCTLTLTGVSGTAPTGTANIRQQGDLIEVDIPQLLGTSNSTSATLTGLPIKYAPTAAPVNKPALIQNNGADSIQFAAVAVGGSINLTQGGLSTGFTSTGQKGIEAQQLSWRRI